MAEYGRIVGESTSSGGGGGGDLTAQVTNAISHVIDRVASLPPEVLIAAAVLAIIALVFFRR
jgi:hypothetical protein